MPRPEWECQECGRTHPKHSPPCSRCGATALQPVEAEADDVNDWALWALRLQTRVGTVGQLVAFGLIVAGGYRIWRWAPVIQRTADRTQYGETEILLVSLPWSVAAILGGVALAALLLFPFERRV